MQAHLQAKTHN